MVVAWLLWLIVLTIAVLGRAVWRVLRLSYVLVLAGVVAFVVMGIALVYMGNHTPYQPYDPKYRVYLFTLLVHWWERWQAFGVARLLPDRWTMPQYANPKTREMVWGLFYVCAAASVTVMSVSALILFAWAIPATFAQSTRPFAAGHQP